MLTKNRPRTKDSGRRKRANRKVPKEMFWVQSGHPDLDRAGDLLLRNLLEIRLESTSRGAAD